MIFDLDLAIESIYLAFSFYTLMGTRVKNKLAPHPWPLKLSRQLFKAGAVARAEFIRSDEQNGRGYIQFLTRWGDVAMLVSESKETRMLSLLNAKTLIARNLPGVELKI